MAGILGKTVYEEYVVRLNQDELNIVIKALKGLDSNNDMEADISDNTEIFKLITTLQGAKHEA